MRPNSLFHRVDARSAAFSCALFLVAAVAALVPTSDVSAQQKDKEPLSANEAQALMLQKDHLKSIKTPTTLRYTFERKSKKADDSFKDIIDEKIVKIRDDGGKDISFDFFTDSRKRPYPDVHGFRTNALVMTSITRDIWQMAREIGGGAQKASYFGKRINMALRDGPKVEEITINTSNGELKAKKVTVRPFVQDPNISRFQKFENKIYEFVFSDDIPGELYMVRTFLPAGEATKEAGPEIEEITKFSEQMPLK